VRQVFQEIEGEVICNGKRSPLRGGRVSGETISFTLAGEPFGKASPVEFTGRIQEHALQGQISDGNSRRPLRAVRNPATVRPIAQ
jgi:hypothetical protein